MRVTRRVPIASWLLAASILLRMTKMQVNDSIKIVDSMIDRLYQKLYNHNLINCVDVIVVSDHGGQLLKPKLPDNLHVNETGINLEGLFYSSGPVGRLQKNATGERGKCEKRYVPQFSLHKRRNAVNSSADNEQIQQQLQSVWHRRGAQTLSLSRFEAHRFSGDEQLRTLLCVCFFSLGIALEVQRIRYPYGYTVIGDHGYDFRFEHMHAIFITQGGQINPGIMHAPFENIQLYNFIAQLLQLKVTAPNNGTYGALWRLIKGMFVCCQLILILRDFQVLNHLK